MHGAIPLFAALALFGAPELVNAKECALAHMQCGGRGWTGPTCCERGFQCSKMSDLVSTCTNSRRRLGCKRKTKAPSTSTPATTTPSTTSTPATTSTPTTSTPSSSTDSPAPESTTITSAPVTTSTPSSSSPSTTTAPTATTATPTATTATPTATTATPTSSSSSEPAPTTTSSASGAYLTYVNVTVAAHNAAAFPSDVPCPAGMPIADCMSGTNWGEKMTVSENEPWHYSRSSHYGITPAGACGFGLYGMCTKGSKTASWTDPMVNEACSAFCKAYPVLCQDPKNTTLRGNFAAPDGKYYSQFWPHLEGTRDNYLSCGECFELVKTKKDGTDYKPGEAGYTDPIVLEITDSCPCKPNEKWCCGSGDDQCQEVKDFKYGCPIPKESTHLDLSDIAMGRLVGNGNQEGIIPTRYRRVQCPKPGNIFIWVQQAGPYYYALGIVNTAGVGGVAKVEIKGVGQTKWTAMVHNPDYPAAHPQERYGSWTIPRDSGTFNAPVGLRITSPNGEQVVNENAIKSFTPPAGTPSGNWYLDFGAQFSMSGKH